MIGELQVRPEPFRDSIQSGAKDPVAAGGGGFRAGLKHREMTGESGLR